MDFTDCFPVLNLMDFPNLKGRLTNINLYSILSASERQGTYRRGWVYTYPDFIRIEHSKSSLLHTVREFIPLTVCVLFTNLSINDA